jgi:serine/threonine protein kinase/Flp pilus assembly protein TadD
MADALATRDEPLSPVQALHVDAVCDRFEAAWKTADPDSPWPRIDEYLGATPEPDRSALLRHLILLDVDYRRLRGAKPIAEDYQPHFPALSVGFLAGVLSAPAPHEHAAKAAPGEEPPEGAAGAWTTVLPHPVVPGMRSDRYVVRQFHAQGGIGEVWLAHDEEIGRTVALKRLRKKLGEHRERFLVEAQITGQLEHPGIVPVHDLGLDEEGQPFYIMTFLRGRTLKDAIGEYHSGSQAGTEAAEVALCRLLEAFVQVCQAVAYAHSRGVIHRDLKPDNVMLGGYGETVVLDWGLAKVRSQPDGTGSYPSVHLTYGSGSSETQAGMVMGSPAYMAPEMAEGRAGDADERTDVYLLGATLYHILTGQMPRQGNSIAEIMDLARTVSPTPPRKLRPDVPRALEAICTKAMAQRQPDRYGGALEVAADVQRYLAGAPVSAYPEPVPARVWRWCRRNRRVLGRSVATAAAVAGLLLFGAFEVREAWRREAAARHAAEESRQRQEAAEREAEDFRQRAQAGKDLAEFRRLCEERQFYAASPVPSGEQRLHYDAPRGDVAGRKALDVADRLTREIDRLPGERDAFFQEFHDLLLLLVQAGCRHSPEPRGVAKLLEYLDRAVALRGPSRGSYRLRARCCQLLGDNRRADEETRHAGQAGLADTALDHFLEAERCRTEALDPAAAGERVDWQPNADLLRQAIDHYRQAVRLDPTNYWAHFQLGRCYLILRQGSEAAEALSTCVALHPASPWAYSARGLTLGLSVELPRHFEDGEADLARALVLEPDFRPALLNRGILAWLQQKYDRALADFGKVLEDPADRRLIEAAYYRGQMQVERGKLREARQDFDRVVQENPAFRPVYLSRAQVHFLEGDDSRGLADLTTFLDLGRPTPLDPKGHEVFVQRGRLLRHLVPRWLPSKESRPRLELARDSLSRADEQGGGSPELFDDLGAVLEMLGEPEQALPVYEKALKAAPPDLKVKVLLRCGQLCFQSLRPPRYDRAREYYVAALALRPGNPEAHAGLGYLYALQRSAGAAQREAAEALVHGAGDYLILHWVACIYAELSRIEPAATVKHQDLAMVLLRQAVAFAARQGAGPAERVLIGGDEAFAPLQGRPDFQQLLKGD